MERISKFQLFCLIMLFEIGSTPLFALGIDAKQDAWIVVIIGMLNGFALMWLYTELQSSFPNKNFAAIIIELLGKWFGIPLALIYVYYYIASSILNFSEFSFLISMTFLRDTSATAILVVFMAVTFYCIFFGLETIGRSSEVMFPIIIIFIITTYILVTFSGLLDFRNLTPVLGEGIKPVLKATYPVVVIVPFGESALFLMYFSYTNSKKEIRRISFLALGLLGLIVTCNTIIIISVLGVDFAGIASVPFLEVIKLIDIGDILTNLDALAIIFVFIGGFYKSLLNYLAGILILSTIFKIHYKRFIVPVGILTFFITVVSIPSLVFHRFIGFKVFASGIHVLFHIFIPILLYMIFLLKKLNKKASVKKVRR